MKPRSIFMLMLVFSLAACASGTMSTVQRRLVTSSEQPAIEAQFSNMPLHTAPLRFDASQFGLENTPVRTLEAAQKKYPDYVWTARTFRIYKSCFFRPDASAVFYATQYYYQGMANAKAMAYKSLLSEGLVDLNDESDFFGKKLIFVSIQNQDEARYRCIQSDAENHVNHQDRWDTEITYWSCDVTVILKLLVGHPSRY